MRVRAQIHSSSSSRIYDVAADTIKGIAWCDCPAWRFQKIPADQRRCKHTRSLSAVLIEASRTGTLRIVPPFASVEVDGSQLAPPDRDPAIKVSPASRFAVLDFEEEVEVRRPAEVGRVLDL